MHNRAAPVHTIHQQERQPRDIVRRKNQLANGKQHNERDSNTPHVPREALGLPRGLKLQNLKPASPAQIGYRRQSTSPRRPFARQMCGLMLKGKYTPLALSTYPSLSALRIYKKSAPQTRHSWFQLTF